MRKLLKPLESAGYWPAIILFELWLVLAGFFLGLGQAGTAAFFIAWNVFRLSLSPFLRFALTRSAAFVLVCATAFGLGFAVYAAPSMSEQRFLIVLAVVIGAPALALLHLLKWEHFEALIAAFEAARDET